MSRTAPACDSCRQCPVRCGGPFAELSREGLAILDRFRSSRKYARGEPIFLQGALPTGVYCLRRGRVRLYRTTREGGLQVIRWANPGEPLGYPDFFSEAPYRCRAEAATEAQVCYLGGTVLQTLLRSEHGFVRALLRHLTRDLRAVEDRLLQVVHRPVRKRVAALLLDLEGTGCIPPAGPNRQEMARLADTTPETLARVLTEFHRQGLIQRSRCRIRVKDRASLERLAEG